MENSKKLNGDHRTIKKKTEKFGKIRTRRKNGFKNVTKKRIEKNLNG